MKGKNRKNNKKNTKNLLLAFFPIFVLLVFVTSIILINPTKTKGINIDDLPSLSYSRDYQFDLIIEPESDTKKIKLTIDDTDKVYYFKGPASSLGSLYRGQPPRSTERFDPNDPLSANRMVDANWYILESDKRSVLFVSNKSVLALVKHTDRDESDYSFQYNQPDTTNVIDEIVRKLQWFTGPFQTYKFDIIDEKDNPTLAKLSKDIYANGAKLNTTDNLHQREASQDAIDYCTNKNLENNYQAQDNGKEIISQIKKQANNWWSENNNVIFDDPDLLLLSFQEDKNLFLSFFANAGLSSINTGTYQQMNNIIHETEKTITSAWADHEEIVDRIPYCTGKSKSGLTKTAISNQVNSETSKYNKFVDLATCVTELSEVTPDVLLGLLNYNQNQQKDWEKLYLASNYLSKYIEYRECLASQDENLLEIVKKERENFNSLMLTVDDQTDRGSLKGGNQFLKSITEKLKKWVNEIVESIFNILNNLLNNVPV